MADGGGLLGNAKRRIQQRMKQIDSAVAAAEGDANAAVKQAGREMQSINRNKQALARAREAQTTDSNN